MKKQSQLTLEQKKKNQWIIYAAIPTHKSFGNPTYTHKVGDRICFGNFQNCIVDEVTSFNGNTVYGFTCTNKDGTEEYYRYAPWYRVRPYNIIKGDTNFTKENNIYIRFHQTSLESLLNNFYYCGVEMNPPYQRGYVWDEKDKESLLDSIFNHIEIGKFAFIARDYSHDIVYEILDGKQRLSTLLDFYENRIPYKGFYFNELSFKDRYTFLNAPVTIGETGNLTMEQIYNYFYTLNKAGKVMDEEHLQMIREQIVSEIEQEEGVELS